MKKAIVICLITVLFLCSFAVAEENWKCPECGVRVPAYLGNICPNCGFDMEAVTSISDPAPALTPESAESLYDKGLDAENRKDYTAAAEYYLQAADQGYAPAQYRIGVLYGNGLNSAEKSLQYIQSAADQGYPDAQYMLGVMYVEGIGVEVSFEKAAKNFQLAADQGYPDAYIYLGYMYENGEGVEQSYEKAIVYYRLAADYGENYAQERLESLSEQGYVPNSIHDPSVKDLSVNARIAIYSIAEETLQRYDDDQCREGEYQSIVFLMENNSSHSIEINENYARVDGGDPLRWKGDYVMSSGTSRQMHIWYNNMSKLSAGVHEVSFYIDGDCILSTSIELK